MFDVLWGRWPRWSEMYNIYSYVQETRVGQTANLYRFGPTWSLSPDQGPGLQPELFRVVCRPGRADPGFEATALGLAYRTV